MTDETKGKESQEGSAPEQAAPEGASQEESTSQQAAEPTVEEVSKKESLDKDKALQEARRGERKAKRKAARAEKELERARQYRQRVPATPPPGGDEQEIHRQKAAAYDQLQAEEFVKERLSKLGLEQDDSRLDYYSPETFLASAAAAKEEDFQDREAELADREKEVESLGDKLRAEAKASIEEAIRDVRRESGLDTVARTVPAGERGTSEAEIREKYKPQLDALKGGGRTGEVMVMIREMEAEIEEVRGK